jgi:hypothetical protein
MIWRINDSEWGGVNGSFHHVNKADGSYSGRSSKFQDRVYKKRHINRPTAVKTTKTPEPKHGTSASLNNLYWDEMQ